MGFAVMGFIGYFVKLIHIPMYVSRTSILRALADLVSQKQHSSVRFAFLVYLAITNIFIPPVEGHSCRSILYYSPFVLYKRQNHNTTSPTHGATNIQSSKEGLSNDGGDSYRCILFRRHLTLPRRCTIISTILGRINLDRTL